MVNHDLDLVWSYPDKYYLCFIHRNTHLYNSLALTFYASKFIYTYCVFACTLMVEIITYMYVLYFPTYINCCNRNKYFLSSIHRSELLHTIFVIFINISYVRCNNTKPEIRGSLCDVLVTETSTITDTKLFHFTTHQESKKRRIVIHDVVISESRILVS